MINQMGYKQNKVVAHFKDGLIIKGYTQNFTPPIETFMIASEQNPNDTREINILNLKALFFVKTFEGNRDYLPKNRFEDAGTSSLKGFKVKVTFADGETIRGMISDFRNIFKGFYFTPIDPECNNNKIYVEVDKTLNIAIGSKAEV